MGLEGYEHHFASKVGKPALTMLYSYRKFGPMSRAFMLTQHSEMLEKIRTRSGDYRDYTDEHLLFLQSEIYVELIERLCWLTEDFGAVCYALSDNDLSDFPRRLIGHLPPRKTIKELADGSRWFALLRYANVDELRFSTTDKHFLRQHYGKNISTLKKFAKLLKRFLDLYWLFAVKRKHANTLIRMPDVSELRGEPTVMIPVAYDAKHPDKMKAIPLNYSMYQKLQSLFNELYTLTNDLLDRAILFIERNGLPFVEHATYYQIDPDDRARLQKLIEDYDSEVKRTEISITLQLNVDLTYLQPFFDFYESFGLGTFD